MVPMILTEDTLVNCDKFFFQVRPCKRGNSNTRTRMLIMNIMTGSASERDSTSEAAQ